MDLRRREFAALMLGGAAALSLAGRASAEDDPLPSWNAGPAKDAIVKFVHATTDAASPSFVPLAERIATFDQDGTLGSSIRSIRSSSIASIACRGW